MEKPDPAIAQMRKGVLEMCVLAVLSEKEAYASDILLALKGADLLVVEGTLYPILSRLKNEGCLQYRWEESTSGPPRKYYSLTPAGLEMLGVLVVGWQDLAAAVSRLTASCSGYPDPEDPPETEITGNPELG